MTQTLKRTFALIALLTLALFPLGSFAQRTTNDDSERTLKGIVQEKPSSGTAGPWKIGDLPFNVDRETEFSDGVPAVGACVEVQYVVTSSSNRATQIQPDDSCQGGGGGGDGQQIEVRGVIVSFPDNLIGDWVVTDQTGNQTYQATQATHFSQENGPFGVARCVEVKYILQGTVRSALAIKTDDSETCGAGNQFGKARGQLVSFPDQLIGNWTIGTQAYEVSAATQLKRDHGDFIIGACVAVTFAPQGFLAHEVSTESQGDCGPSTPPTGSLHASGKVDSRPNGSLFGSWRIGGTTYEAITNTTTFDLEHGDLRVDQCAEVTYDGTTKVASRIQSSDSYRCGGENQDHELYGVITTLPITGTNGTWEIGGRSILVTNTTELKGGPFSVGMNVKVHFVSKTDGTLEARQIEAKNNDDHHGGDNNHPAKGYGIVDALPAGPDFIGNWTITGVTYSVSTTTRLENTIAPYGGSFVVGMCVEFNYTTDANGARLATKIEGATNDVCGRVGGQNEGRDFGSVDQMPPTGFVGTWIIAGVTYDARSSTEFKEEHGVFGTGAFVEAAYTVENGVRVAHSIKTHVPPGAGDDNRSGRLQHGTLQATGTWIISGRSYQITTATILNDTLAPLVDGQAVTVNGYLDTTGNYVATLVTAVAAAPTIYLPLVVR